MKSLNLIDKSLIGCFLVMLVMLFATTPAKAQSGGDCTEYCESLCGTDNGRPCQYTFCPGSTGPSGTMCNGILEYT